MSQITHTQAVSFGNNTHSGNIISSFNNNTFYKSDEDAQIMRWLSPLEPNNRHQDVRTGRFGSIGGWLLETSEFREWRDGEGGADKAVLFCSGNPGVGKTYLSSLVIDSLCDQANEKDIAVACLYYDFLAQQEQTITNTTGAILKQLIGRGGIPEYLRDAFQKGKKEIGGRGLLLADLMGMLRTAIASIPQVFICIDALDECLPRHLPELLESLGSILREFPRTRIFLTGRPHVSGDIQRHFPKAVVMPICPNTDDLKGYLEMRLGRDDEPEAMNDDLQADIVRVILERISDIFLLVSLSMDAILGEGTIRQRRKKLEEMTQGNGLSDAYATTLRRLKVQKGHRSVFGLKVLMWVSHSERPLRAEELCHALGVELGSTDLDPENVPALRTLLASCLGLVTVEASSSTVRLVHFTLQEHLSGNPALFRSLHSTIGDVCLTYLNFRSVWHLSPALDSPPSTMPLLDYASCFWGKYVRMGMTENAKMLALKLLGRFEEHISARLLLLRHNKDGSPGPYFFGCMGGPTGFTGLHGVAFFGIVEMVAALLDIKEWDLNATDSTGSTALTWAAARGQEEIVNMLLEREGVNPSPEDTFYGQTPLSWAAQYGHVEVVKMLLERRDVDPNQANTRHCRTPLSWAAEHGQEGVVKLLLEREDLKPNQASAKYHRTPLSWATVRRHEGVVKVLLERGDVDPNKPATKNERTPLSSAAERGYEGIVKMLLERVDINPNQVDTKYGRTPLSWAAWAGHEGVVKMLLERGDVNPTQADAKYGRTPLSWAAGWGHEGVVKMLLGRGGANPDQVDTQYGWTPLLWAASGGYKEVVEVLLRQEEVNPTRVDTRYGRAPLSWAAGGGHGGVVRTLLERSDVDPDQADTRYGRPALSWAAWGGHEEIVNVLLQRGDVNPDRADTRYGRTALLWAAWGGHEEVVKILLRRRDVNPDRADTRYGRTPLSWAAERGHEEVVKVLLEQGGVDPEKADTKYGWTPLVWAVERGHQRVVTLLSERKDVHTVTPDNKNQTPLPLARSNGCDATVGTLLVRDKVNFNRANHGGLASLQPSTRHEDECVVEMQFARDDPGTDIADSNAKPTPSSADPGGRDVVLVLKDSIP